MTLFDRDDAGGIAASSRWLRSVSATTPPDDNPFSRVIWDRAGFHTSGKLKVPVNVTIVELPPYSPELNPAENLWHYFKSHYWSNRFYEDYQALEERAVESWRLVAMDPELMKTVCAAPYVERAISG